MEKKARLAARATIRHCYTGYEETLEEAEGPFYGIMDYDTYHDIKQDANELVNEYIREHRKTDSKKPIWTLENLGSVSAIWLSWA